LLVALVARYPASSEIFIRFALSPLPLTGPEPSLLSVDPIVGHLTEQ